MDPRFGDVTVAVLTTSASASSHLDDQGTTTPLVEGALGVGFYNGPLVRRHRLPVQEGDFARSEVLNFSQVVVGVGYRF